MDNLNLSSLKVYWHEFLPAINRISIKLKKCFFWNSLMIYAFWYALEMVHYYYEYFMFPVDIIVDISTCFSIRLHDLPVLVSNGIKTFSLIWQAQDALSYWNIQSSFDWMKPLLAMSFKCSINVTNIARIHFQFINCVSTWSRKALPTV